MGSWSPADLVGDVDLADYENDITTGFGQTTWQSKRTKALEDWLFPILKGRGFDPYRLRTRADPALVYGYTASVYTDRTGVVQSTTEDDLNLQTLFATVGTDALFIGSDQPFRGLFFRLLDSVSTVAGTMTVSYWNGNWEALTLSDGTIQTSGKTLSAGGSVTWIQPTDWTVRTLNGSAAFYWAKVTVSATPTSAKATQIGVIRSSCLRAPATFRTLELIFREAPTGQDGPWTAKAQFYKDEADAALQRALAIVGGEFDSDESDQVSDDESQQTSDEASGGPWVLERG